MGKILGLITALVIIIGVIFYLNSQKATMPEGNDDVIEIPIATNNNNAMSDDSDIKSDTVVEEQSGQTMKDFAVPKVIVDRASLLAQKSKQYERAKEITTPDGFINTDNLPITIAENIGKKVILLDIWTYSCINCQRTLPYVNSWQEKYGDKGLLIIGLHTPEFEFEKEYENVKTAVDKFGIKYPVVLDNDYSTWRAYKNNYWPRKYIIDIDGFIVYDHIGEGGYEETEKKIQEFLEERSQVLGTEANVSVPVTKAIPAGTVFGQSPETYFGAWRNDNFGNGKSDKIYESTFVLPNSLSKDEFYLSGKWKVEKEYIESLENGASMEFRYTAKEVYMVAESEKPQDINIKRDGELPGPYVGLDVKEGGIVSVGASNLYKLIKEPASDSHVLRVEASSPGFRIYTLTFGS